MKTLLRTPVLHFLLLGGLLFAAERLLPQDWIAPEKPIRVSSDDWRRVQDQLRREYKREPTPAEAQAGLRHFVDEEVLLREALRLGLDSTDKVARQRQLMNMRFAFPESKDDDETLLRAAQRLHMAERDMVVRNRLIQEMEKRLSSDVAISDAEMRAYLAKHPQRYDAAARYSFRQIFFSSDIGDGDTRASTTFAALRAGNASAAEQGDVFLLGGEFKDLSLEDVTRILGADFAKAVSVATVGQWSSPFKSAYGQHLIFVERSSPAQRADFAGLRQRLAYALIAEKEQSAVREALPVLRARYGVASIAASGASP